MIKQIFIVLIKLYRYLLSPLMGNQCRFHPTCSVYAEQAFQRYSCFSALFLTIKRLARCQPFSKGGIDELDDLAFNKRSSHHVQ